MKHYKDSNNVIYAYELDGSQDDLIGGKTPINDEEANIIRTSEQASAFAALSYAQKRQSEYPPFTDYLDGVAKGDQAQIDKYIADCLAVKVKYPKE
jgi:hypothetical protein